MALLSNIDIFANKEWKLLIPIAQRWIQKLEAANIIQQTSDAKRNKVYCAHAILTILEESTKIKAE